MIEQMPTRDLKHIKIDAEAHRIAKVAAAEAGMTLEAWIAEAIKTAASVIPDA